MSTKLSKTFLDYTLNFFVSSFKEYFPGLVVNCQLSKIQMEVQKKQCFPKPPNFSKVEYLKRHQKKGSADKMGD